MRPAQLRLDEIARTGDCGPDGLQKLVGASLAVRAAAMEVLEAHRLQMERSGALVRRARALCARLDATLGASPLAGPAAAPIPPRAAAAREEPRCVMSGCSRPARFRPCFVVNQGIRRILVTDMPLRVCSEHRGDLDALFRRPSVLEKLRRKLRGRRRAEPDAVHLVFDVVG